MDIKKIPLTKIEPAYYNPRRDLTPDDPEYQILAEGMEEFGLVEPLVWNKRSGRLVSGHQRLKILIEQGATEVECSVVDLDDTREKALNIRLNKQAGTWDDQKLKDLLQDIDTGEINMDFTGFPEDELRDLMSQFYVPPPRPAAPVDIIEKYTPTTGKSTGDECWFYIEFYGEPERYAALKEKLAEHISGHHQLDHDLFERIVEDYYSGSDTTEPAEQSD